MGKDSHQVGWEDHLLRGAHNCPSLADPHLTCLFKHLEALPPVLVRHHFIAVTVRLEHHREFTQEASTPCAACEVAAAPGVRAAQLPAPRAQDNAQCPLWPAQGPPTMKMGVALLASEMMGGSCARGR